MSNDGFVNFPLMPATGPLTARIVCDDHPAAVPDVDHEDHVDDEHVTTRWTRFSCSTCGRVLTPEYLT